MSVPTCSSGSCSTDSRCGSGSAAPAGSRGPGRRSQEPRPLPVIPVQHDGARYLVSTRGEAQWVRNLRAAGEARIGDELVRATELPVPERAPVIAAYRAVAGRTVERYFADVPAPDDHPVFHVE